MDYDSDGQYKMDYASIQDNHEMHILVSELRGKQVVLKPGIVTVSVDDVIREFYAYQPQRLYGITRSWPSYPGRSDKVRFYRESLRLTIFILVEQPALIVRTRHSKEI